VVKVKTGYARNYLLPRGKAMRATEENRKEFEARRVHLEASNLERRSEAEAIAGKVDGISVVLIRQAGEAGQLYGSVSARDVADGVTASGVTVSRDQVRLDRPIKTIGLHEVRISLHPEVVVTVKVNVARSEDEAEVQAKTGEALIHRDEVEEEDVEAEAEEAEGEGAEPAEAESAAS
jgi:large subunit ribosomal protein L9